MDVRVLCIGLTFPRHMICSAITTCPSLPINAYFEMLSHGSSALLLMSHSHGTYPLDGSTGKANELITRKHGNPVAPEKVQCIRKIMDKFAADANSAYSPYLATQTAAAETFMAVSLNDITCLLASLYPLQKAASLSSDRGHSRSGLQSSASSISGFSLFRDSRFVDNAPILINGWTPEPVTSGATEDQISEDPSLAYNAVRLACLELDDLSSNRGCTVVDRWEILVVTPDSSDIRTMRDELSQCVATWRPSESSRTKLPKASGSASMNLLSIKRSIESLLVCSDLPPQPKEDSTSEPAELMNRLQALFQHAIRDCSEQSDYVTAHTWSRQLDELTDAVEEGTNPHLIRSLLADISESTQQSIGRASALQDACQRWIRLAKSFEQLRDQQSMPIRAFNLRLRDKMWYVADVRTSANYDQISSIAAALRIMGKTKKAQKTVHGTLSRHWSGTRQSSMGYGLKSEARLLEILCAKVEHGGPNKLADDQAKTTRLWMDRNAIDNLCQGEERIHKFCLEVRKCVDAFVPSPMQADCLLSSNPLFTRDEAFKISPRVPAGQNLFSNMRTVQTDPVSHATYAWPTMAASVASHTLSTISSSEYLDRRSPTLTHRSSKPFWSPATTEAESTCSVTSVDSSVTESALDASPRRIGKSSRIVEGPTTETLRQKLMSFLISELTVNVFSEGSETDVAFWTGLGGDITKKHFSTLALAMSGGRPRTEEVDVAGRHHRVGFRLDYRASLANLMQKFAAASSPSDKLAYLYDMDRLLVPFMTDIRLNDPVAAPSAKSGSQLRIDILNNASIAGFRYLFLQDTIRPATIFRDLQYSTLR